MDDINAGLNMSKIQKDGSSELDFAVIHAGKDYQIAAHFLAATAGTTPAAKELTASFWQQVQITAGSFTPINAIWALLRSPQPDNFSLADIFRPGRRSRILLLD